MNYEIKKFFGASLIEDICFTIHFHSSMVLLVTIVLYLHDLAHSYRVLALLETQLDTNVYWSRRYY